MKRLLTSIIVSIITLATFAQMPMQQPFELTGKVVDSKTGEGLMGAIIKATSSDGGSGTFAVADSVGSFTLKFEQFGRYEIEYSCIGYKTKTSSQQWIYRGAKLSTMKLKEDNTVLKEVTVTGLANRAAVKGDTLVYSADAFKVMDGASAAELVNKMPGITVDREGVKAQGEKVQKLTVDGKEFFEYDPQLALNTLPAEVVRDVQVYDKKSDKAEMTGFDDGARMKAMNLNTKAYKRNGVFGKIYGGGGVAFGTSNPLLGSLGDGGLFKGGFNLNIFSDTRRISLLGLTNNVDQTFFDFGDLNDAKANDSYGVAVHENGVARANAFGLNFNDEYLGGKLKVSSSYFTNITRHESADSTEMNRTDMSLASIGKSTGLIHNNKHIFNSRITFDIDKNNTLLFIPKLTYLKRDTESNSTSRSWLHDLDSLNMNPALMSDIRTIEKTHSTGDSEEFTASASLRFTHRFPAKMGRSLSAEVSGSVANRSATSIDERDVNSIISSNGNKNHSNTSNLGANVSFTEPLAEKHLLELGVSTNYNQSHDYNNYYSGTTVPEDFSSVNPDPFNSFSSNSHNFNYSGYANYNWRFGDFTLIPSISYNHKRDYSSRTYDYWDTTLPGAFASGSQDPSESLTRSYSWVKPSIQFNWRKMTSFVRASYSMDQSTPNISDLYTKLVTSNPYSFFVGNPDLQTSQSHRFNVNFSTSNPMKGTNIYAMINYSHSANGIGTSSINNLSKESVLLSDLPGYGNDPRFEGFAVPVSGSISTRINNGSTNNFMTYMMYSAPIKAISCNYNIGINATYSSSPQEMTYYLGKNSDGSANLRKLNGTHQMYSITPNVALTSTMEKIDFAIWYTMPYYKTWSDIESSRNVSQLQHNIDASLKWEFLPGLVAQVEDEWQNLADARDNSRINQNITNISLAKKFGKKNSCEIKLEVHDLFNQNKGYNSMVASGMEYSSWSKQMPRYAMATFTYQLKK
ncbi:MAG: TonB-dependent receptor [Bacteroidaceae bacterium]|nr:TonB-dependent receptor [Bacteroidaceae bacterium]